MLEVYTDGSCEPINPGGVAAWAWVAYQDGAEVVHAQGVAVRGGPGATNNVAEYHAVLAALRHVQTEGWHDVAIYSDSRLVVEQVAGRWRVRAVHLQPLAAEARGLLATTRSRLEWVPRERNARADALAATAT